MAQFSGTFNDGYSNKSGFHLFTSEDEMLVGMNLCAFNVYNCREMYKKIIPSLTIAYPGLPKVPPFNNTIIELGGYCFYYKFILSERKYSTVPTELTIEQVYALIEYHDKRQSRKSTPVNTNLEAILHEINHSNAGCVTINILRGNILPGISGTSVVKLYFQKSNKRNSERIMTQKGPPMITATPALGTGTKIAGRDTRNFQQETPNNTGGFLPPVEGGDDNPRNTVTAPLKLTYNATEKVFESGNTQILAKLLTDVAGADITNTVPPTNIQNNDEFFDPASPNYLGAFTTGLAMPLNVQNGNPHMFGPNIDECKKEAEKVRCVNRSPKSFEAGRQVMLTSIGGEWIIGDLGEPTKSQVVGIEPWAFSKFLATSDAFFRNHDVMQDAYDLTIKPEIYIASARQHFYANIKDFLKNTTVVANLVDDDDVAEWIQRYNWEREEYFDGKKNPNYVEFIPFHPNGEYMITTVFDNMSKKNGGFLSDELVNINNSRFLDQTNEDPSQLNVMSLKMNAIELASESEFTAHGRVFPFWGPLLTNGYKTVINFTNKDFFTDVDSKFFNRYVASEGATTTAGPDEETTDPVAVNLDGFTKTNIPAELTSKIITTSRGEFFDVSYFQEGEKRNLLRNLFLYPPNYGSESVNNNRIQFVPLSDVQAGSTDRNTYTGIAPFERDFRNEAKYYVDFGDGEIWADEFFARMNVNKGGLNCEDIYDNPSTEKVKIPFDCFIKKTPINVPSAATRIFRDGGNFLGSNLVAATAGWTTMTKPRGGEILFEVDQYLGVPMQRTNSGSTDTIGFLMGFIPITTGYGGSSSQRTPQWGSNDDEPWDFGTSSLHFAVYDYWPEDDTYFDPRYFTVLHFNPVGFETKLVGNRNLSAEGNALDPTKPEKYGSKPKYTREGIDRETYNSKYRNKTKPNISYSEIPRLVSTQETSVDIRVPTYETIPMLEDYTRNADDISAAETQYYADIKAYVEEKLDSPIGGTTAIPGQLFNRYTRFKPENEWNILTLRRGQLLSGGGFTYVYPVLGLSDNYTITSPGEGFEKDEEIKLSKDAVITVTQVGENGELEGFIFRKISDIPYFTNLGWTQPSRGIGFLPSDFSAVSEDPDVAAQEITVHRETFSGKKANGKPASVEFYNGMVWNVHAIDEPPKQHGPITNVAIPSNKGEQDVAFGKQSVSMTIGSNQSGKYSLFAFFHNDIGNCPIGENRAFIPGYLQYLDLTIK